MTITPVSPINKEKLVSVDTSILVNLTAPPTHVDVNGLTIFDGAFFQNGWTGSLLNLAVGKRLVLTPPAPFSQNQVIEVYIQETGGDELIYRFETGTTQVTVSSDLNDPTLVVLPDGDVYLGYLKNSQEMYIRFTDPLSAEVKLIEAKAIDIGYDPTLNKIVVFFINNEKVYVSTADPGDGPNLILPPAEAQLPNKAFATAFDNTVLSASASASEEYKQLTTTTVGVPVKVFVTPGDATVLSAAASSGEMSNSSSFPQTSSPVVISLDPRIIRIPRPSSYPESSMIVGFYLYKGSLDYTGGRFLPEFIPLPNGTAYVDYTDPAATPRATYSVLGVYRSAYSSYDGGGTAGTGSGAETTGFSASDAAGVPDSQNAYAIGFDQSLLYALAGASEQETSVTTITIGAPLKVVVPLDSTSVLNVMPGSSEDYVFGR